MIEFASKEENTSVLTTFQSPNMDNTKRRYITKEGHVCNLENTRPEISFIRFCADSEYIICKDKYGIVELSIRYHIKNSRKHTINSAANKSLYWRNLMNDIGNKKYDYSKANYTYSKTKVILICKLHGEFQVTPNDHITKKSGCPECGFKTISIKNNITNEEFIRRSTKKFGGKYNYSKTKYLKCDKNIYITCPIHGAFHIVAYHHLSSKTGCPECGKELNKGGYCVKNAKKNHKEYKKITATIYILQCQNADEEFFKIGITKSKIAHRINAIPYKCKIIHSLSTNLLNAIFIEKSMLKKLSNYAYKPKICFGGYTECFSEINKLKIQSNVR